MLPEILISLEAGMTLHSRILEQGFTTFGRLPNSDVCLDDPSVSRNHGAFSYRFGVFMVEDHGSSNGVFVNGLRVKRCVLLTGDKVQIGPFEIYIKHGSEQPKAQSVLVERTAPPVM